MHTICTLLAHPLHSYRGRRFLSSGRGFLGRSFRGISSRIGTLLDSIPCLSPKRHPVGRARYCAPASPKMAARVSLPDLLTLAAKGGWHSKEPARSSGMPAHDADTDPTGAIFGGVSNRADISFSPLRPGEEGRGRQRWSRRSPGRLGAEPGLGEAGHGGPGDGTGRGRGGALGAVPSGPRRHRGRGRVIPERYRAVLGTVLQGRCRARLRVIECPEIASSAPCSH